ncbi:hypothetical protein ACX3P1_27205 [Mesorhizobium sp. A623]
MAEIFDPQPPGLSPERVKALALETGTTEDQIRAIIELIGPDRASIIREARNLKRPL